jgi:flagellar motor switch protein FliG
MTTTTTPPRNASRRKAALALGALGPERAAEVLRTFPESAVVELTAEMANIGTLNVTDARQVLQEVASSLQDDNRVAEGGPEFAHAVLDRAFGADQAAQLSRRAGDLRHRPFVYLESGSAVEVARAIGSEPPAVVTLALAHLPVERGSAILSALDADVRADVALRLAELRAVHSSVIEVVDQDLRIRVSPLLAQPVVEFDGLDLLAQIVGGTSQSVERQLLTDIAARDAAAAERVREVLFVFDDIVRLNDRGVQELLKNVDTRQLAVALKGADSTVQETVFRNLSERARENLRDEIEILQGLRPNDIRDARKAVVGVVRQLEEAGTIVIERAGGEDEI